MRVTLLWAFVAASSMLVAADKKPVVANAGNREVSIDARAYLTKDEIKQVLGAELPKDIVVVEVTFIPKSKEDLKLFADDFELRSFKDGQKSGPFAPSQIAGKGALVVTNSGMGGGIMSGGSPNAPVWGGMGGRPQRLGGDGGAIGNTTDPGINDSAMKDTNKEKDDPLLVTLKEKALEEGETSERVTGLLYFPLEGKHKGKDLTLVYNGQGGRLLLEFGQ